MLSKKCHREDTKKEGLWLVKAPRRRRLLTCVLKYSGISESGKYEQLRQSHEVEKGRAFLKAWGDVVWLEHRICFRKFKVKWG